MAHIIAMFKGYEELHDEHGHGHDEGHGHGGGSEHQEHGEQRGQHA